MAQRTVVIPMCDVCGKAEGDGVETHVVEVDRKRVSIEACERCWTRCSKGLDLVFEKGRKVTRPRKRKTPRRDDDPVEA